MSSIVDQKALNEFLENADVQEARRVAAALDAMASAAYLAAIELETRSEGDGPSSPDRRPRRGAST